MIQMACSHPADPITKLRVKIRSFWRVFQAMRRVIVRCRGSTGHESGGLQHESCGLLDRGADRKLLGLLVAPLTNCTGTCERQEPGPSRAAARLGAVDQLKRQSAGPGSRVAGSSSGAGKPRPGGRKWPLRGGNGEQGRCAPNWRFDRHLGSWRGLLPGDNAGRAA